MNNILAEIYQHKLIEVRNRKKVLSVQEICAQTKCQDLKYDFFSALREKNLRGETALICEIKKGSPSAGLIRADFNVSEIAQTYEKSGATCLSVLTDEKYFLSQNSFLSEARAVSNLPILRKDFIVDSYQIYEAKMLGANCVLLIVAMLDDSKLYELEKVAFDIGLSVLVEIHDESELNRALKLKSKLIGINNRNLKTLKVDLKTSLTLAKNIPNDYVLVSESGIKSAQDIKTLKEAGINCFLIGEHFMRQADISQAVSEFLSNN